MFRVYLIKGVNRLANPLYGRARLHVIALRHVCRGLCFSLLLRLAVRANNRLEHKPGNCETEIGDALVVVEGLLPLGCLVLYAVQNEAEQTMGDHVGADGGPIEDRHPQGQPPCNEGPEHRERTVDGKDRQVREPDPTVRFATIQRPAQNELLGFECRVDPCTPGEPNDPQRQGHLELDSELPEDAGAL